MEKILNFWKTGNFEYMKNRDRDTGIYEEKQ